MEINTIDQSCSIHYNDIRNIAINMFTQICLEQISLGNLSLDKTISSLNNSCRLKVDIPYDADDLSKIQALSSFLLYMDVKKESKEQGGYGIILNTLIHSDKNIDFYKHLAFFAGVDFSGVNTSKSQILSFLKISLKKINQEQQLISSQLEYAIKSLTSAIEFINLLDDDEFIYITSENSRYSDSSGCFNLHCVMSDDEQSSKFKDLVLEHEITELDDIDNTWFEEVLTKGEKVDHIKNKYKSLLVCTKDLYFNNNYNISTI